MLGYSLGRPEANYGDGGGLREARAQGSLMPAAAGQAGGSVAGGKPRLEQAIVEQAIEIVGGGGRTAVSAW